jgi:hypothetical protein
MLPEHFRFGGGAAESTLLPLMAVCLLIGVVLTVILPREKAITPFLVAFFTIPFGQAVVLGGFHFTAMRVLILAGLAKRAISQGSSSRGKYPGGFNGIDQVVVLWSVSAVAIFCLTFMEKQAFINGLGILLDSLGGYLVVRFLIPDREAMRRAIKTLAAICVIEGVPMIGEQITHINVFGLTGAVSLASAVRNGSVRASGTLGALTAGPFAGIMIPMFLWLWAEGKSRIAALAGIAGAMAMVVTSNSSTSWMALFGSLVGLAFWRFRTQMRQIRWGLVITLVALHLYMKAPVWALISRVDLTGSSSSYQRYVMVDMAIRHFSDWWLMGAPDYVNWGWDSWDLCNQFVAVALTGGLLTLIFYVAIFKRGFQAIGTARKLVNGDRRQEWTLWCLGSTLFATVVIYFGINSVGVLLMVFFVLVACISVATLEARQPAEQPVEVPVPVRFASGPGAAGAYVPLGEAKQEARHGLTTRGRERFSSWLKA